MPEAVIFDFDGVIADTMKDNCIAWIDAFAPYGFNLPPHEYYMLEGMGRYQIAQHFIKLYNLHHINANDVVEAKENNYKKNNTFRLFDGVKEIFHFLKSRNIPVAIVTGASKARINEHLPSFIRAELTDLVTADDVTHTKPHPEPYLKAVEKLRKAPENCIVIENAVLGIKSAKDAGCKCFALETTLKKHDLNTADEVFANHKELLIKFEKLFYQR